MIRVSILLVGFATVVVGGRSPRADLIEELEWTRQAKYSDDTFEDAKLDVPGLIARYGYPHEIHNVITSDGYILEAHRIPHGRDNNNTPDSNKPVVFLMHGLLSSSADFVVLGPERALAYMLAEAGYDVWLGNARGNFYSRRHRSLNPDSSVNQNFWRFSWDEIGNHDLPAFIDYILDRTGHKKLHYVGHSQGGTSFLVLNSLRPEYNDKFISFQGLAPAAFFTNNDNTLLRSLAPIENLLEAAAFAMGIGEIFGEDFCIEGSMFKTFCDNLLGGISNNSYINQTLVPVILGHTPAGASVRQVAHFGQCMRFDAFRRYNHNTLTNIAVYGRATPPGYDLSKITVPAYLHYGLSDKQVNFKDVLLLSEKLKNTVGTYEVERPSFNHFDFIWASDARTLFYENLLEHLKDAESKYL